jgi:hypothetical protein
MKRILLILATIALALPTLSARDKRGFIVVTDHIKGKEWRSGDVSDALQRVIDENPNRVIFFPDGEYIISKPIITPAEPEKSVSLELSAYAIIRAAEGWSHNEAMIRLGGKCKANNITKPGSNYYLAGGIIDCMGVAKGISIDSGRETAVRNCSIKNARLGLHIKHGANSGSSDCDITDVNIVGCRDENAVGVLVEGYDNTFTNMRIGGVHTGFIIKSSANCLRNIHPLYYGKNPGYETSCGFVDERGNNFYDFCYSDEFATAFRIKNNKFSTYTNCFAYWYSKRGEKHLVFRAEGKFNSCVTNLNVGFGKHNATKVNRILECDKTGGKGVFENLHIRDPRFVTDNLHEAYCK